METDLEPRLTARKLTAIFPGDGEMATRCREFDWSSTPLGPVEGWSQSLKTATGLLLASRNPMFLWWGPELIQIYNDAYRPSFGETGRHPSALGMAGRDCWTDIWPTIYPQIEQVMSTGVATWHIDSLVPIERNGRLEDVWWTYSYSPVFDDDGRIGGTLVVCQETTQRVLAERERDQLMRELQVEKERLVDAFRQAPTFLAVMRGPRHVFEFVNDAYYALTGHRDLVGRPIVAAIPEAGEQGFVTLLDRVLKTGEPYVGREVPIRLVRTPGAPPEERFVDFIYQPLVESDGSRSGIVAHGSDVTEQVLARRQVERLLAVSEGARADAEAARATAERANRAKSEFLAVMSHELRTPLNAIGGYAELMEIGVRGPLTEPQRSDIERIQLSQRHLLGLINEVLNYAKLDSGAVRYNLRTVPLREVLSAAESLVAPQARSKGLSLSFGESDPVLAVRSDAEKLRQVIVNLLSNAVKFTDRGGRISVRHERQGDRVVVRVSDTGIGIPADKLDSVFDPFVQVRSDLTRPYDGTGLGLAISRDLARGMGGDLTAESTLDEGSTFTLVLPAA